MDMTRHEAWGVAREPDGTMCRDAQLAWKAMSQTGDEHIAHVNERIRELGQLKQQLSALRKRCHTERAMDACGILQGLATMETEAKPEHPTHLG